MRMSAIATMALALGGLTSIDTHTARSRPQRRHYSSAYTDGAVCQYPVGFPLPAKRKPRTNKNRNYRKARKARRLKAHLYAREFITGCCDRSALHGTCGGPF